MTGDKIRQGTTLLQEGLAEYDPHLVTGESAIVMVRLLVQAERSIIAAKALYARRVEETKLHRRQGHRDAAQWLASESGESTSDAAGLLAAARQMEKLPHVEEAFKSGKLSGSEARQVAGAASKDPSKQEDLLQAANEHNPGQLRAMCDRVRRQATSAEDESARYEDIRRRRYYRDVTESDGAVRFDGRVAPDDAAKLRAELMKRARRIAAEARAQGRRERLDRYLADALMELVNGVPSEPGAGPEVQVTVDAEALVRGYSQDGETCKVAGVGQVPVATARQLLGDGFLNVIVTKGVDVRTVARAGRAVSPEIDIALRLRDPVCCVPGCEISENLERDHRVVPFADGGPTSLDNLARLCKWHHYLRTYQGWRLDGEPGDWRWIGPDSERDPEGSCDAKARWDAGPSGTDGALFRYEGTDPPVRSESRSSRAQ